MTINKTRKPLEFTVMLLVAAILLGSGISVLAAPASTWDHIVDAIAFEGCTIGLRSDGKIVFAGEDQYNMGWQQAELWTDIERFEIIGGWIIGYKKDGSIDTTGDFDVSSWTDVVSVAADYWQNNFMAGLRSDGTVSIAFNENEEISRKYLEVTNWRNIKQLVYDMIWTGSTLECALIGLRNDGTVEATCDLCWGYDWKTVIKDIPVNELVHTYGIVAGIKEDGTVFGIEHGFYDEDDCFCDIESVTAYYDGYVKAFGLRKDGTVAIYDIHLEPENTTTQEIRSWRNIKKLVYSVNGFPVGLRNDGTVAVVQTYWGNPVGEWNVSSWTGVQDLFCAEDCLIGLKADGTLLVTGGQFGTRDYLNELKNWTDISTIRIAEDHIVGLKTDGTLVAAGDNSCGQCNVM